MITIILEHASPALKGTITKWISLVKPSVYVGEVNARVREALIETIQKEYDEKFQVSAQIYYSDRNELGYSVVEIGNPTKVLADFQGLQLISEKNTESELQEIASLCWAKLNPYKSAYTHMYETGILAKIFLTISKYNPLVSLFSEFIKTDITNQEVISTISFICACHDIGKVFPNFQKKAEGKEPLDWHVKRVLNLIKTQEMMDDEFTVSNHFRHEMASESVIKELLSKEGTFENTKKSIASVYLNHHLVEESSRKHIEDWFEYANPKKWKEVQKIVFNRLKKEFNPYLKFEIKETKQSVFTTLLLGFLYRCDWISSSLFTRTEFDSKDEYKQYVYEKCIEYVDKMEINLLPTSNKSLTMKNVFTELNKYELRFLQKNAEEIKDLDFDCILVEDLTGSGKTEAGFYLAYQAMLKRKKQGIFFGLPTNATEETMNPRIQEAIDAIYGKDLISVTHATGTSWIMETLNCDLTDQKERIASSKETKLMFPFSTGTVDQIIKAGLKQKYALIPLMELATKAVIIDEVHAYDGYMRGVLSVTLQWLKEFHVPVVIMSATLPDVIKEEIHKVYSDKPFKSSDSYPLMSVYNNNELKEYEVEAFKQKKYEIQVTTLDLSKVKFENHICDSIRNMIKDGGNVCVICNTVSSAINTYDKIQDSFPDIENYLFQGQTTLAKKHDMTNLLVSKYGKDRSNRPKKSIVIATQIVEQSIDLDFDFMISELAPIDLLIQRFGRWHRHSDKDTIRENLKNDMTIEVVAYSDIAKHYVYRNYPTIIEMTKSFLENHPILLIPEQSRAMIEHAYTLDHYSEMEKVLCKEKEGKALFNSIDSPQKCKKGVPYKKTAIVHSGRMPTRDAEGEYTYDVCVLSDGLFDEVTSSLPSKKISAEIKYYYTLPIKKRFLEKMDEDLKIEGKLWLEGCIIIRESTYNTYINNTSSSD